MKIRISGNSVRFRLTKTDIHRLTEIGTVTETTQFGTGIFSYSVRSDPDAKELRATFEYGCIELQVPAPFLVNWSDNDIIGWDNHMTVLADESLYVLLEKDFKCLDRTTEDESEHFENPKKNC
jgi:hypothetical protein